MTSWDPPEGTEALLFDCDGTLVDTVSLYRISWHQVFGRYGFDMSDDWYRERQGLVEQDFIAAAFPDLDAESRREIARQGRNGFEEMAHLLRPLEPVVAGVGRAGQRRLGV